MVTEVDLKGPLGRSLLRAEESYTGLRFQLAGRLSAPLPGFRVAVVGTTEPSGEGLEFAVKLVENLVRERATVVSGLVKGIGAAALRAAIDRGGTAVAVLVPSVDALRPEIVGLQSELMREQVVVSPLNLTVSEEGLTILERAVALLSDILIVTEAGELEPAYAVREAARLGRKIFVSNLVERKGPSWFRGIREAYDVEVLDSPDRVDGVLDPDNFVANPEMRRFLKDQRLACQSVQSVNASPAKGMWREAKEKRRLEFERNEGPYAVPSSRNLSRLKKTSTSMSRISSICSFASVFTFVSRSSRHVRKTLSSSFGVFSMRLIRRYGL
jgi:DNA processing protein